jgi:hypothetical protein
MLVKSPMLKKLVSFTKEKKGEPKSSISTSTKNEAIGSRAKLDIIEDQPKPKSDSKSLANSFAEQKTKKDNLEVSSVTEKQKKSRSKTTVLIQK